MLRSIEMSDAAAIQKINAEALGYGVSVDLQKNKLKN